MHAQAKEFNWQGSLTDNYNAKTQFTKKTKGTLKFYIASAS